MNEAYLNLIAAAGASEISHIELQADNGTPIADGRQAVTWTSPNDGLIRPTADLQYDIAQGEEVGQWEGFNAATGGTGYGPVSVTTRNYSNPGTYTLAADQTGIDHNVAGS